MLMNWDEFIVKVERLFLLFRKYFRFHNTITRIVVIAGLALAATNFNFIQVMAVAVIEEVSGPSELVKALVFGDETPWVGVVLVGFGLIYNLMASIGMEYVDTRKSLIPKMPSIKLEVLNIDEDILNNEITLRGVRFTNNLEDIPDYSEARSEFVTLGKNRIQIPAPFNPSANRDLFRQRAEVLEKWGGSEILSFRIQNTGDCLANQVQVKIEIKKAESLAVVIGNGLHPEYPQKEKEGLIFRNPVFTSVHSDIENCSSEKIYTYLWKAGDLPAQMLTRADTNLFIRCDETVEISITVFCDQFSEPLKFQYKVQPANTHHELTLGDITDKDIFDELYQGSIMDNYFGKKAQIIVNQMKKPKAKSKLVP
jgi:hypothetical protein